LSEIPNELTTVSGVNLSQAADLAEQAALEVGSRIATYIAEWRENTIHYKGEIDIATDVDLWSERKIRAQLIGAHPTALFVGEESIGELSKSGRPLKEVIKEAELCWVVDPIDGTNNFSNHIPHVAVSIALLINGVPQVGVVYDPVRKEMFRAILGQGTTLNGEKCFPSKRSRLIDAICGISFPVDRVVNWSFYWTALEAVVLNTRTARVLGSGVTNLCWTACGRLDGLVEHNLKIWDVAAGVLIAQEAGCIVANSDTDQISEKELPLDLFKSCLVVAGPDLFEPLYRTVTENRKIT
jgi:myo-inositol-1(or 4)-monophosphatase